MRVRETIFKDVSPRYRFQSNAAIVAFVKIYIIVKFADRKV